jgi:hypothetical protein
MRLQERRDDLLKVALDAEPEVAEAGQQLYLGLSAEAADKLREVVSVGVFVFVAGDEEGGAPQCAAAKRHHRGQRDRDERAQVRIGGDANRDAGAEGIAGESDALRVDFGQLPEVRERGEGVVLFADAVVIAAFMLPVPRKLKRRAAMPFSIAAAQRASTTLLCMSPPYCGCG